MFALLSLNIPVKKNLLLLVVTLFFFGATFSFGVSIANASFFDFIRAFVTINPLSVEVTAPSEVEIGEIFKVETNAINSGEVKIENVVGEIFLPVGLSLLGSTVKNIGVIPGGKEKKIFWQVKGKTAGKYIISVSISGVVNGDAVSAGGSKLILVNEKTPPGRSPNVFENFFDFLEKWFGKQV